MNGESATATAAAAPPATPAAAAAPRAPAARARPLRLATGAATGHRGAGAPAPPSRGRGGASTEPGAPIRGAGAAIAANMERSLAVPTATSFRNVPAKLLEVNRKVINGYRARSGMGKVSFTHLIGYAIVRAIADAVPVLRNTFAEGADGKPRLIKNDTVNMGLAVDVEKSDGSRTLVVPVIAGRRRASTSRASSPPTRSSSARSRPTS